MLFCSGPWLLELKFWIYNILPKGNGTTHPCFEKPISIFAERGELDYFGNRGFCWNISINFDNNTFPQGNSWESVSLAKFFTATPLVTGTGSASTVCSEVKCEIHVAAPLFEWHYQPAFCQCRRLISPGLGPNRC